MNVPARWVVSTSLLALLALPSPAHAQNDGDSDGGLTVTGTVTAVTLFRDSALVTRTLPLTNDMKLTPGNHEIVVAGLPERIVTSTVFAEGSERVAIRAVRVTEEPVVESTREEIQLLDDQLDAISQETELMTARQKALQENLASLDRLISFSQRASDSDLGRGVLDAESLTKLYGFTVEQREQLNLQTVEIKQELQELEKQRSQLTRQRSQLTNIDSRSRYLARIFVDVNEQADAPLPPLKLTYSVTGCDWSPQYTIGGHVDSDQFELRYGAIIGQLSGEDWQGVKLTLSTASPAVSASGPTLLPLRVTAVLPSGGTNPMAQQAADDLFGGDPFAESPNQQAEPMQQEMAFGMGMSGKAMPSQMAQAVAPLQSKMKSLRSLQRQVESKSNRQTLGADIGPLERDQQLNRIAGQMQELEFMAAARKASGLASDAEDEVASQTYVIEGPVSLQSKREQQLVEIVEKNLTGTLYHVATPLLSSFAYREAELVNELPYGLLSGPASVYLNDRFVGTMSVPTTASGQRLRLGFGADGQVRTRRELVDKSETVQGGNRRLRFDYKLVVNNFKEQPIDVRLYDRIPMSNQTQQTQVTLGEVSVPLSDNKLYNRIERPVGILRWDLKPDASTHGAEATDVTYDVTIEFDRSRVLSVPDDAVSRLPPIPGGMGGGMGAAPSP